MSDIRLVVFDLGGVIVRHCRSWAEGCAAAGLELRDGCESPKMTSRRRELARQLMCGSISESEFYRRMSEAMEGLYQPTEIERVHCCWTQEEYEGTYDIVQRLKNAPALHIGVLSNTNAPHWRLLADRGRYPTVALLVGENRASNEGNLARVHASHLLGLAKPDPAVYAEYQRRADIAPEAILFFEDLPENAAAARAAVWTVEEIDWRRETAGQIEAALKRHKVL